MQIRIIGTYAQTIKYEPMGLNGLMCTLGWGRVKQTQVAIAGIQPRQWEDESVTGGSVEMTYKFTVHNQKALKLQTAGFKHGYYAAIQVHQG